METVISFISLGIALFALGWNVYKDVIQKPRFKASVSVCTPVSLPHIKAGNPFVLFSGINLGLKDIVIKNIVLKCKSKTKPYAIVLPNTSWTKLPQKIAVGDEAQVITDYFSECFLSTNFDKAGLIDSYGRYHWVSKKNINDAKERFREDFENTSHNRE